MDFKAEQIAQLIEGTIIGDPSKTVNGFANIDKATPNDLTFLGNAKYVHYLQDCKAGVVIVSKNFEFAPSSEITFIQVEEAYAAMTKLLSFYDEYRNQKVGVEQPHFIAESANVGENPYIGAFAYVGENVKIGNNVKIYPHVYIGDNVKIGDNTILYSGAKVYQDCSIANDCIIHASVVIGSDGFGFAPNEKGEFDKVPQIGNVVIEDKVEIGSMSTIDRATMGSTIIRKGTKLDNQIQVAHNVEIGENNVIASQTGIAGSTKIGSNNMIGGQVGIVGHLNIGSRNQIQAQSGVNHNIGNDEKLYGSPALDAMNFRKAYVQFRNLPQIVNKINKIEKEITQKKER